MVVQWVRKLHVLTSVFISELVFMYAFSGEICLRKSVRECLFLKTFAPRDSFVNGPMYIIIMSNDKNVPNRPFIHVHEIYEIVMKFT